MESGTNEIEIMEFVIAENTFGINVAKVREILRATEVKQMPHAHPAIEGVFKPRDTVLTVDVYKRQPVHLGIHPCPLFAEGLSPDAHRHE